MSTCIIDGCDRPVFVKLRGWCGMHYKRWYSHGNPNAEVRTRSTCLSYRSAHNAVRRAKGNAKERICECGKQAQEWAWQHGCPDVQFVTIRGKMRSFCKHVSCYEARCRSCHVTYDYTDEARARISISNQGKHGEVARRVNHTRWHVNRGIVKSDCVYCTAAG